MVVLAQCALCCLQPRICRPIEYHYQIMISQSLCNDSAGSAWLRRTASHPVCSAQCAVCSVQSEVCVEATPGATQT